ncbi:MAG TPA: allophanate hydrolase subunit 1 [Aeromicrobium sp.]|nr:allophanate hydrolase subunit 1 [Aeromicrobium sp.]
MRILPCGDRAVLLDCSSLAEATAWSIALADVRPVLGARTVLLRGKPSELRSVIASREPSGDVAAEPADEVVIAVEYDGPDLAEVARMTVLTEDEVVGAHTGTPWTVAFGGFAPGFAYLVGGDSRLQVPRRSTPRTSVPAGAVGLAGEFSGIYPRSSPGGWQLIGRSEVELFDVHRDPPALLQPGMRVRFEARR